MEAERLPFLDRPVGYATMRWALVVIGIIFGAIVGPVVTLLAAPEDDSFDGGLARAGAFVLGIPIGALVGGVVTGLITGLIVRRARRTADRNAGR